MKPKISVCVAVYNPGKFYLERCLNSIVNQTLEDIEIIIVNDGSTDNSIKILRSYAAKDNRIKIIDQSNKGLSMARRVCVSNASGEYIGFIDNDDYIELNMYEEMYEAAIKNRVDIVEAEVFRGKEIISSKYNGKQNTKQILRDYLKDSGNTMLWMRIYRKGCLPLTVFPTDRINNEDVFAYPCILYAADSIYYLKKPFYYYNIDNIGSVMKNYKKNSLSRYNILRMYLDLVPKHIETFIGKDVIEKEFSSEFRAHTIGYIFRVLLKGNTKYKYNDRIRDVCDILNISETVLENIVIQSVRNGELSISPISVWLLKFMGLKKWVILATIRSAI